MFKSINFLCIWGLITTTSPGKLSVTLPKLHPAKLGQYQYFCQDLQFFHPHSHIPSSLSLLAFNIVILNSRELGHGRVDAIFLHLNRIYKIVSCRIFCGEDLLPNTGTKCGILLLSSDCGQLKFYMTSTTQGIAKRNPTSRDFSFKYADPLSLAAF